MIVEDGGADKFVRFDNFDYEEEDDEESEDEDLN